MRLIIKILKDLKKHGVLFTLVGLVAAIVHFGFFNFFIQWLWPEIANIFAFLGSFIFSFMGHRYLTFSDHQNNFKESLLRFFSTAGLGFLNNEIALSFCYRILGMDSRMALLVGISTSALQTFLLSRYWAFHKNQSPKD